MCHKRNCICGIEELSPLSRGCWGVAFEYVIMVDPDVKPNSPKAVEIEFRLPSRRQPVQIDDLVSVGAKR